MDMVRAPDYFDHLPEAVVVLDETDCIVNCNKRSAVNAYFQLFALIVDYNTREG